jgi:phospholipase/carboxylesterase
MLEMDRRRFVRAGLACLAGSWLPGCGIETTTNPPRTPTPRLTARPGEPDLVAEPGVTPLGIGGDRDGLLAVPEGYDPDQAWPFLVLLHGAGGDADAWQSIFPLADEFGVVMMAPDSRANTWDVIRGGGFGPDVTFIDEALAYCFRRVRVDPARLALGGFSDGASYALSMGLANGDLLSHVIAFSPGFLLPTEERGKPEIFISHGTDDPILAFEQTNGQILPLLQEAGYDVTFRRFEGGHEVPLEVARDALAWLVG